MLSTIEVELKLVIAGNHDTSLDHTLMQDDDDDSNEHEEAMEILKGPLAKEVGISNPRYHCSRTI